MSLPEESRKKCLLAIMHNLFEGNMPNYRRHKVSIIFIDKMNIVHNT